MPESKSRTQQQRCSLCFQVQAILRAVFNVFYCVNHFILSSIFPKYKESIYISLITSHLILLEKLQGNLWVPTFPQLSSIPDC